MNTRRWSVCLAVLVLSASPVGRAYAMDYYVDSVGGDDTHDGHTAATAWRTVDHLETTVTALHAGDTVYFRAGSTFDVSSRGDAGLRLGPSESGTAASPIRLTHYGTGPRPLFQNFREVTDNAADITILGDYVIVDGLELAEAHYSGVTIETGATHVTVTDCDIHHVGVGVVMFGDDATVTHCLLHDGTMVVNTMGGTDDYGANGVVISADRAEVSYNRADRLLAPCYDFTQDGGFVELYDAVSGVSVHHNVVHDSDGFMEGGSGSGMTLTDGVIAYNESVHNGGFTTVHVGGTDSFRAIWMRFLVSNNTIIEDVGAPAVFWFSSAAPAGSFTFQNNVVRSTAGRVFQQGGMAVHSHNQFPMGVMLGVTADATDATTDPMFVSLAGGDYHLAAGSPAIDTGATAPYPTDLDGVPVPSGAGVDRGAYERGVPGVDAGVAVDAAVAFDAAVAVDAAASVDAATTIDAGTADDAATTTDAGSSDAAASVDAASSVDAGAGRDAASASDASARDASSSPDAGAATPASPSSCGCAAAGAGPRSSWGWLALGLVALVARRRRR